jgi:hypothetical protein
MAIGDRISSARTAGLMRRINALENTWVLAKDVSATTAALDRFFAGGQSSSSLIYYGVSGAGIKKNSMALDAEANFISEGTITGSVDTTVGDFYIAYSGPDDRLYVADKVGGQVRVQSFNGTTGGSVWETQTTLTGSNGGIGVFASAGCVLALSGTYASGTADGTSTNKLIDSGATFTDEATTGVGMAVLNDTDVTRSHIVTIDSDTELTLEDDIFVSGEDYTLSAEEYQHFSVSGTRKIFDRETESYPVRQIGNKDSSTVVINARGQRAASPADQKGFVYTSGGTLQETLSASVIGDNQGDGFEKCWHPGNTNGLLVGAAVGRLVEYGSLTEGLGIYTPAGVWVAEFDPASAGYYFGGILADDGSVYVTSNSPTDGNKVTRYTPVGGGEQTTWYHYPTPGNDTGKATLGAVDYGVSIPVDSALSGYRPHYFELRDMRTAIESVAVNYYTAVTSGVTDGTTTDKLVNAGSSFTSEVTVGDQVFNTTDGLTTTVSAIDSDTVLSLNDDIFVSGEAYLIKTNLVVSGSVNNNLFTLALGGGLTDWTTDPVSHADRILETDYSDIGTILTYLEGGSLA